MGYRDSLPLKDIADRLERSVGTIKANLFHVHRRLHDELLPYKEMEL